MWRVLGFLHALVLCLYAGQAEAGAWPRQKGALFVSTANYGPIPTVGVQGTFTSVYLEYGLTDKITVGLDLGRGVSGKSKTVVFGRIPIGPTDGKWRFAAELGIGKIAGEQVIRPGLSIGRSVDWADGGWLSLDLTSEVQQTGARLDIKGDFTFGLRLSPRLTAMVQIQGGLPHKEPDFLRIVPSILFDMRRKEKLEFGLSHDFMNPGVPGIKVGYWKDF